MANQRYIHTTFWGDEYIQELNCIEKLLFIYFLTNEHTNICGVYRVSVKTICFETGVCRDDVLRALKKFSLDNKVHHIDGWIRCVNFAKYQSKSNTIQTGIRNALKAVPDKVLIPPDTISISPEDLSIPLDTISIQTDTVPICTEEAPILNSIVLNSNLNSNLINNKKKNIKKKKKEREYEHEREHEEKDKRKKFTPPSLHQVKEHMGNYSFEKNIDLNIEMEAEAFLLHYSDTGWTRGNSRVKIADWKKAASGWVLRSTKYSVKTKKTREETNRDKEREYLRSRGIEQSFNSGASAVFQLRG